MRTDHRAHLHAVDFPQMCQQWDNSKSVYKVKIVILDFNYILELFNLSYLNSVYILNQICLIYATY